MIEIYKILCGLYVKKCSILIVLIISLEVTDLKQMVPLRSAKIFLQLQKCRLSISGIVYHLVNSPSVSNFKNGLDRRWISRDIVYDWHAELTRYGSRSYSSNQWYGLWPSVLGEDRSDTEICLGLAGLVLLWNMVVTLVLIILKDTTTFQVLFLCSALGTSLLSGAALGGGSRGPDPPAPTQATCGNCPDPMSFFGQGEGVAPWHVCQWPSGTFVFWRISVVG